MARHLPDSLESWSTGWLNIQVIATKQRGKKTVPYFKSFDDFFKDPLNPKNKHKKTARNEQMGDEIRKMLLRANSG